jgi:hypothetical protein
MGVGAVQGAGPRSYMPMMAMTLTSAGRPYACETSDASPDGQSRVPGSWAARDDVHLAFLLLGRAVTYLQ